MKIPTVDQVKTAFRENQGLIIQKVATVGGVILGLVAAALVNSDRSISQDIIGTEIESA